jgi:hypothetical protein
VPAKQLPKATDAVFAQRATNKAMNRFVVMAAVVTTAGCSKTPVPPDASTREPAATRVSQPRPERRGIAVGTAGMVGNLMRNEKMSMTYPSQYCVDQAKLYKGAPFRLGKVNVFTNSLPGGRDKVDALAGKTVLLAGKLSKPLFAALSEVGPCDSTFGSEYKDLQMRSDWVSPEGGFLATRERLDKLSYWQASTIRRVTLSRIEHDGKGGSPVIVTLLNPFDKPMSTLEAKAHYEGGTGKPMPKFVPIELALPPGAKQRLKLAKQIPGGASDRTKGPRKGAYHLDSIDISGSIGATEFDVRIDIPATE